MLKLKRKFGDRYDGYRVKKVDPFFLLVPHIMKKRVDSQVFFEEEVDITELEKFVRRHGETDIPGLKMYHLIAAACVRLYSQRPCLNRFCIHGRIFARNNMRICMSILKGQSEGAESTIIKPEFELEDTLQDVVRKFNAIIDENRQEATENGTDATAGFLGHMPVFLARFAVNLLAFLDRRGIMPKMLNEISPFHTSLFITNLGSIGIKPVYHHIYEFGTTSIFVAMGKKRTVREIEADGTIIKKRKIDIKVVADERICDGHYYATSMRMLAKLLQHPERLLVPPEEVVLDPGIDMKGR